jgi:phosphate transporter
MRFEQQLVFNASNEWVDEYINYTALKAAVYRAEKEALVYRNQDQEQQQDEEQASLLGPSGGGGGAGTAGGGAAAAAGSSTAGDGIGGPITPDTLSARFKILLDAELAKIENFYSNKEQELFSELDQLKDEVNQVEEEGQFGEFDDDNSEGEESGDSEVEEDGAANKLLKKSTKLFRSVVGASGSSSSTVPPHHHRRRSSVAANDDGTSPYAPHHKRSASSSSNNNKLRRQQSHTASEGSGSSIDAINKSTNREMQNLPPEVSEDIESQINRTMQAATRPSSPALGHGQTPISSGAGGGAPLQSPFSQQDGGVKQLRRRASSFGGPATAQRMVPTSDIWNSSSRQAQDMRITFKLRLQALFRELSQLKEYITLNQSEWYSFIVLFFLCFFPSRKW